jgi:hypothetical protein
VRFRSDASLPVAIIAIVAIALCVFATAPAVAQNSTPTIEHELPTKVEVRAAIDKLKADTNLSPEQKTRTLKWKDRNRPPPQRTGMSQWLAELFQWIGQSARFVVWGVIAILVAMFVVAIIRQLRQMELRQGKRRSDAPTHVRDLDIRPESLPDDIGAAALELWERGDQRAALSLLYRGLLSRLVHDYQVPIKQSSTEGDCLELAENHLQQDTVSYVGRLIRVWQRAVYGGKEAQSAEVRELCAGFGNALVAPRPGPAGEPA